MRSSRKIDQYILLYLLQRPFHGFELYRKINRFLKGQNIDTAGIYRTLDKLESQGAVTFTHHQGDKGPAKKIYSITPVGKNMLKEAYASAKDDLFNLNFFIETYKNLRNK